ncbi:MAG: imidazoleglycerol-phosphate dehydratase HisB [Spirochaetia bacterium]|nr:imidazoleglycerol-phosphate dehydratase HisB [Spirochaetota bacterium]MCX8097221.1 imidazoleglycerol-phosphate dehydratase HisB [Spirochaetota bacterium]MDW8111975.1 imidazoleglycerol-phosphate dehydratase HisB [Spirochaetia bacterium]
MRISKISRETLETSIEISVNLDGSGVFRGTTSVGFFDHLLSILSKHSSIDIEIIKCKGDTHVDFHHLVEDFGIVLGKCFDKAIGDKKGISRFGFGSVPLDEALSQVSLDVSGRPYLYISPHISQGNIREFDMELLEVFFLGFVREAKITLHIDLVRGSNRHHIAESVFKSFALALKNAIKIVSDTLPSTKGVL